MNCMNLIVGTQTARKKFKFNVTGSVVPFASSFDLSGPNFHVSIVVFANYRDAVLTPMPVTEKIPPALFRRPLMILTLQESLYNL